MRIKCRAKPLTGQSVAELAILGSLILFAVATLLTYGQRFEAQQQAKQEAFRRALARAYDLNSAVTYTLKKDVRFLNLFGGYGEGQASSIGASASVMWVKGAPGRSGSEDTSFSFYRINNQEIELPRYEKNVKTQTGADNTVMIPVGVWKEEVRKDTHYSSTNTRSEDTALISNTQASDLGETINTTLYTRYDTNPTDPRKNPMDPSEGPSQAPQYIDKGTHSFTQGAYYQADTNRIDYRNDKVGTTIHKERSWSTDH